MRLHHLTAGIAVLALILGACGDDDGGSGDAGLDAYADALATSFQEDPENAELGLSDDEVRCFADETVETIGLEQLQEQGSPEELVANTGEDLSALDLQEQEREAIAAALFRCADGLVERLQDQLVAETGLSGEQAECVAGLFTEEVLIQVFAASLSGDAGAEIFGDLQSEFQACTA